MKERSTSEDIVVFDGYDSSAKDHCRLLKSPIRGLQIDLDWNTPVTNQQPVFLSNPDNKSVLIGFLGDALDDTGIEVDRCRADAHVMIAQTAFTEALRGESIRLWGDDTDLMVILLHLLHSHSHSTDTCTCKIHMFRHSMRTTVDLSTLSKTALARTMRLILAVHAFSGCDTVSGTFGIGKTKLIKQLEDVKLCATLKPLTEVFMQYNSITDALLSAELKMLSMLYSKKQNYDYLDDLRLWSQPNGDGNAMVLRY